MGIMNAQAGKTAKASESHVAQQPLNGVLWALVAMAMVSIIGMAAAPVQQVERNTGVARVTIQCNDGSTVTMPAVSTEVAFIACSGK